MFSCFRWFGHLGDLTENLDDTPANGYVTEDGTTYYVTEDGLEYYVQES